jgi:hypothetical protein
MAGFCSGADLRGNVERSQLRFDRPVSPEPENSDPIAASPGFDLPFNNFVE